MVNILCIALIVQAVVVSACMLGIYRSVVVVETRGIKIDESEYDDL